jgi:hypothetical protein
LATGGDDTLTNTGTLNFQVGGGQGARIFTGDLVNSGTVNVNYTTTFNKGSGSYTNSGVLNVLSGQVLDVTNSGSFTNQGANTLTGGTFDIAGALRYSGAYIQTNQAEIILRGGGAIHDSSDNNALRDVSTNGASGKLRLLESSSLSTSTTNFTNSGIVELGGGFLNTSQPMSQLSFNNTTTGQLRGSGNIGGPVNNSGLVSPGASAGILGVLGFSQTSTGSLAMEIGGTDNSDPQHPQFDKLNVSNNVSLDGTLLLSLINNFTPNSSDTFTILNSGSVSGAFANVANGQRLFTTGNEGSFLVTYNSSPGSVVLSSFKLNIGDYNGNDRADAADYVTWRKSPGTQPAYVLWREHFGQTVANGAGLASLQLNAVPEPGALLSVVCALCMLTCSRLRSPRG